MKAKMTLNHEEKIKAFYDNIPEELESDGSKFKSKEHSLATKKIQQFFLDFITDLNLRKKIPEWLKSEEKLKDVEPDKNLEKIKAHTFNHLPDIHTTYLNYIRSVNSDKIEILELGCSEGRTVWKSLLANKKATVTASDLYKNQVQKTEQSVKDKLRESYNKLTVDYGDALEFITRNPSAYNKYDVIFAQNLIHYFTIDENNKFADQLYSLLKPGGKIFIVTEHIFYTISHLYPQAFNSYLDYILKKSPQEDLNLNILYSVTQSNNLLETFVKDIAKVHSNLGHYYFSGHTQKNEIGYPIDNLKLGTTVNNLYNKAFFDSKTIQKFFNQKFTIDEITCHDSFGKKTACNDDIINQTKFYCIPTSEKCIQEIENSHFIFLTATKPLVETNIPLHSDDL
jgi:2-polyprenyl-3-methyl-5-hydroxy-6-metoxy-1,4-benzoquinol methylase